MIKAETEIQKTRKLLIVMSILLLSFALEGCVKRNVQSSLHGIRFDIIGEHYLMLKDHKEGLDYFIDAVERHPDSPEAYYYAGRFSLASDKPKQSIAYLKKATSLLTDEPDYHFWLGVAYGEAGKSKKERKSYQQAIKLKKDHLQAIIYLGNNHIRAKEYEPALALYQRALKIWPHSPSALYNRALASKYLKRTPEEKTAWQEYLQYYPSGALARRAVTHLNQLGDFSYRLHHLGARVLSMPEISFKPLLAELSPKSHTALNLIGASVANMNRGTLHIVTFQKNNLQLARARAISIRRYLIKKFPELKKGKIRLSWFSSPEKISIKGRKYSIGQSVNFFTVPDKK